MIINLHQPLSLIALGEESKSSKADKQGHDMNGFEASAHSLLLSPSLSSLFGGRVVGAGRVSLAFFGFFSALPAAY